MDNPFVILSYIAGPALLTNATSLLTMATTNRFARAVDRARHLLAELAHASPELEPILRRDLEASQRRAKVIARAMAGLYLAAGMFALATMLSVVGGVLAQLGVTIGLGVDVVAAAVAGGVGFVAFVTAAIALIEESRLALRALTLEAQEVDIRLGRSG
jgi:hypothetical protein